MRKIVLFLIAFSYLCLLFGCGRDVQNDDFFAMDTYMSVSLTGTQEDVLAVKQEVSRLDELFGWDNVDAKEPEVLYLIDKSAEISTFTDGAFDITVGYLMELWGFRSKEYSVPDAEQIKQAIEKTGHHKMLSDFKYDFGAIAKGYASDKVMELLKKRGIESAIISLGGNVVALGTSPNGSLWKVGIKNPSGDGDVGYVEVEDRCVVTSGGYERYFESEGKTYSHIIDPKTGYPADAGVASVTVVSKNGMIADALSTAFYVLGEDKTKQLCISSGCKLRNSDFAVIIIDKNGKITVLGDVDFTER